MYQLTAEYNYGNGSNDNVLSHHQIVEGDCKVIRH